MTAMTPSRNEDSPVKLISPGDNAASDIGCCTCCTLDKPCKCDDDMAVEETSGRETPPIGNCWSCLLGKIGFQEPFCKLSATPTPAHEVENEAAEEEKEVPEPPPSYDELMSQEAVPAAPITPQLHESEDELAANFTFSHKDVSNLSCGPDVASPTHRQPSPAILVTQFEQSEQVLEEEELPQPSVEEPLIIERQDTCESYLSDMPREEELEEDAGPDTDCTQELQDYIKHQLEKLDIGEDLCSDDAVDACQTPKLSDEGYQMSASPRPTPPITNIIQATEDREEEHYEVPVEDPIEETPKAPSPDLLMFSHSPPRAHVEEPEPVPSPDILMFDSSPSSIRKSPPQELVTAPSPDLLMFDHSPVAAVPVKEPIPECLPPVETEEIEDVPLNLDDLETVHLTAPQESEPEAEPIDSDEGFVTGIKRVSEDVVEKITSTIDHVIHGQDDEEAPEVVIVEERADVEQCSPDLPDEEDKFQVVELPSPPVEEELFTLVHLPESPPAQTMEKEPVSPSGSAEFQVIDLPVPDIEEPEEPPAPMIEEEKEETSNFREFCANPLDKFGKLYDIYQGEPSTLGEVEPAAPSLTLEPEETSESEREPMPIAYDLEQEEEEYLVDVMSTVPEESPQSVPVIIPEPPQEPEVIIEVGRIPSPKPEPSPESEPLIDQIIHLFEKSPSPVPEDLVEVEEPVREPSPEPVPDPTPEPEVIIEGERVPSPKPEPSPESEPLIDQIIHLFEKSPSPVPEDLVEVEEPVREPSPELVPEPTPEPEVRERVPSPKPEPSPEPVPEPSPEPIKEDIKDMIEHIEEFFEERIIEPIEEMIHDSHEPELGLVIPGSEEIPLPDEEVVVMEDPADTPMSVESWKTAPNSIDLSIDDDALSTLKRSGSKRSSHSSIPRSISSRASLRGSLKVAAEAALDRVEPKAAPVKPKAAPMEEEEEVKEDQVSVVDVAGAEMYDEGGEPSKKKKKKSRHIPIFLKNIRKDLKEGKEKKEGKEGKEGKEKNAPRGRRIHDAK